MPSRISTNNSLSTTGLAGLVSAQRYLDAYPAAHIAILEKGRCVGGVFGRARLYPGFHTQWTIGLSEFADYAMQRPPAEDCVGDSYKAQYTMEYLESYAAKKGHGGRTLGERIKFGVDVRNVEKVDGGWRLECTDGEERRMVGFTAEKVMVATGVHNQANVPQFEGRETFGAPSKLITSYSVLILHGMARYLRRRPLQSSIPPILAPPAFSPP